MVQNHFWKFWNLISFFISHCINTINNLSAKDDSNWLTVCALSYSCGCVIIDTWSAGECEIKLDCAWYYPNCSHACMCSCMRVSHKKNYTVVQPHADNPELLHLPITNTWVCTCIKIHSSVNDNTTTVVDGSTITLMFPDLMSLFVS